MSEKPQFFGVCLHCGALYDECRCPDRERRARVNRLSMKAPGRETKKVQPARLPGKAKEGGA